MKAGKDASLVMDALMMAVWRRGKAGAAFLTRTRDRNTPASSINRFWPTMGSPAG